MASGARRDMGQAEAAVVSLQVAALEGPVRPWTARLRYAYADALLEAGREDEARQWFARAAEADTDGLTDAEERLLELDGVVLLDHDPDDEDDDAAAGRRPGSRQRRPERLPPSTEHRQSCRRVHRREPASTAGVDAGVRRVRQPNAGVSRPARGRREAGGGTRWRCKPATRCS